MALGLINDGYGGHSIVLDIRRGISFQQKIIPAHTLTDICVDQSRTEAHKKI